jgi:hypothetical protein
MHGRRSSYAEDPSGNEIPKISSEMPRTGEGAGSHHFIHTTPNGNADPGPPISGQVSRMQLNDPNPQNYVRLKNRTQKNRCIFSQHPNPNRTRPSPKRDPMRRTSCKSHDRPIRLRTQFDRAVWGEPSGCALNSKFRFVNQRLHWKPSLTKQAN